MRIGGVPFGVGAPLLAGLESESGVDFVALPPARLIEQLRAGHLDAALVSSVEAARLPGYRAPAGLGIACKREIRSVRAFRRRGVPIRNIGIDEGSATSVALLRILLARRYADEMAPAVGFTPIAPTTRPDELPHDLVLLIGDAGLAADAGSREVWDLGQQWRALTGLPFVFALWLLRPGADADAILPVLQRARQRGRALGPVDGTAGAAHYELDAEDLRGAQRVWDEAQSLGLATAARPTLLAAPLAVSGCNDDREIRFRPGERSLCSGAVVAVRLRPCIRDEAIRRFPPWRKRARIGGRGGPGLRSPCAARRRRLRPGWIRPGWR